MFVSSARYIVVTKLRALHSLSLLFNWPATQSSKMMMKAALAMEGAEKHTN